MDPNSIPTTDTGVFPISPRPPLLYISSRSSSLAPTHRPSEHGFFTNTNGTSQNTGTVAPTAITPPMSTSPCPQPRSTDRLQVPTQARARLPPLHSRSKPLPSTDLQAGSILNLGEFQSAPCLSTGEAHVLLKHLMAARQTSASAAYRQTANNEVLKRTMSHLENLSKTKKDEQAIAIETILRHQSVLEPFERAQLASLLPREAEEAKTLIPSLMDKVEDSYLQELLDTIATAKAENS